MNRFARLARAPITLVGGGIILIVVVSIILFALSPAPATPPPPDGSPIPSLGPTPVPGDSCTIGGPVATPTPDPGASPTVIDTTHRVALAKLPAALTETAGVGPVRITVSGAGDQELSLAISLPDGQSIEAEPSVGEVTIAFELETAGTIDIALASTPKGASDLTYVAVYRTPGATDEPTPAPTLAPTDAGPGDRCAYISVYVHVDAENTPIDPKAVVVAKRITLFENPSAPSIDVVGIPLADGGWSLAVGSGASWRLLVDNQRVFDREAARQSNAGQICPEVAIQIVPGQTRRFIFDVYRHSGLITCPGPVALIDSGQSIVPDAAPTAPPLLLNPVRLGIETGQVLRYRADVVEYLRSLEETNKGISPLAGAYFLIGVGGMVLFGSFAIWLLFGAQDLEATKDQPLQSRRRRRWRR